MSKYHIVLTIAGSDSGGGAGIQADIKTISALGGYAASVVTALTAQNTMGVSCIFPVSDSFVHEQLKAVWNDIKPDVVKIGMLNDNSVANVVYEFLSDKNCRVVLDPVMVSTSGSCLMDESARSILVDKLFSISTIVTPNLFELSKLTGSDIVTVDDMINGGRRLLQYGCDYVLVKGGHLNENVMTDVLISGNGSEPVMHSAPKIATRNLHGTGCTLSSAIATFMSFGYSVEEAVRCAKEYVYNAIYNGKDVNIGSGNGPLDHFYEPKKMIIF